MAQESHAEDYQYGVLDPDASEIRLLVLSPSSSRPKDAVQAHLITTSIDKAPEFEAMSYRWTTVGEAALVLDGRRHSVSQGVFDMLHALQHPIDERIIWIDCICINQADHSEKESQVKLMAEIYRSANRVVAWLMQDPPTSIMPATFSGLQALKEDLKRETVGSDKITTVCMQTELGKLMLSARAFYQNEYFFRVWIIQEVSVAKRVDLRVGKDEMEWDDFVDLTDGLCCMTVGHPVRFDNNEFMNLDASPNILLCGKLRQRMKRNDSLPIGRLIRCPQRFECTDSRDRLYGMLGMSTMDARQSIDVNYHKCSAQDVSIGAARYVLTNESMFTPLQLAGIGYQSSLIELPLERPTWSPDLEASCPLSSDLRSSEECYHTATKLTAYVEFEDKDKGLIVIRGSIIDNVIELSPIWSITNTLELWSAVEQACTRADELQTSTDVAEADNPVWRTIFCDSEGFGRKHRTRQAIESNVTTLKSTVLPILRGWADGVRWELDQSKQVWVCLLQMTDSTLCFTKEGRVGRLPPYSQKGDVIAIFDGADTPFVLRPLEGRLLSGEITYLNVGRCYIDGIMLGELDDAELQREMIRLM